MNKAYRVCTKTLLSIAITAAFAGSAFAQDTVSELEEVIVLGQTTYGNSLVTDSMMSQQSTLTSINSVIDNLPGVTVNEGDVYGFDDWSTSITVRGFVTNLAEQQVGSTIDGIPNGGSNYGGGSKANRFLDPGNLQGVEVSQGTADIASRSLEALGGTLNYLTSDPEADQRIRAEGSLGEFDASRVYLRYDTGTFAGNTSAWVSYSYQEASDWIAESAENEREHFAGKIVSQFNNATIKGYISYDDIHEDNYQRVYSEAQFDQFSDDDGLTARWTGVPVEDQLFRQGWSTLRENLLSYVTLDLQATETIELTGSVYYHENEGRGDWLPPYLVGTDGLIFFTDAQGNALAPAADCVPTYTITNWYGLAEYTAQAHEDPSCYADDAIAVMSFRNTHYEKERTGFSLDGTWEESFGEVDNQLRAGIWYEDQQRDEYRDWHSVDTRAGFVVAAQPYWVQYDRSYPTETTKWYLQDTLTVNDFALTLGIKQFSVEVEREDNFDASLNAALDSDSDALFSGGAVWTTPVEGLEAFFGYAENFKALNDLVLEREGADFENIDPETSETLELGVRYDANGLRASAVVFQNDFDNRLIFLAPDSVAGPDFLIGTNGAYFNAGGIESEGVELSVNYDINAAFSVYAAYTFIDATYLGSGDPLVDAQNNIEPGDKVAGIPKNTFVTSLDWANDLMFAGISVKYTGERFVNQDNTWEADENIITDAYLGSNFDSLGGPLSNLRVNLVVNNLFDEQYLGTISSNAAWIGGPRTLSFSATVDF